jgi:hypothetical protein
MLSFPIEEASGLFARWFKKRDVNSLKKEKEKAKRKDAELMPFHERYVRIKSYSFSTRLLDKFLFRHVDTATMNQFLYRGVNVSEISEKLVKASKDYTEKLTQRIRELEKETKLTSAVLAEAKNLKEQLKRHEGIVEKQTNPTNPRV